MLLAQDGEELPVSRPQGSHTAAGGAISTADNLATWIRTLVAGNVFNAEYQKQWLQSLQPEDPNRPDWQQVLFSYLDARRGGA